MEAIVCSECGCALPKAGYGSSAWKKRTLAGGIVCKHCSTAKDWYRVKGARHPVNDSKPQPFTVEVSHILLKYAGVEDPTSFRDPDGSAIAVQTHEGASAALVQVREELLSGDSVSMAFSFGQTAKERSDCPSAMNRGSLKMITRKQMHPPFEAVAFALDVGDLSDVCTSPSGAHLIYRHR